MKKFDNIVVGLDISKTSISVLQRAFLLAKESDAKVTIVHAINTSWFTELFSSSNLEELQTQTRKNIEEIIELIDTKDTEYSILIDKESASTLVVETAKKLDACLIIIGANDKENKDITLLGSTAHKIAQNSKMPIIIVKSDSIKDYNNIVSFSDLSEISYASLKFAKDFFKKDAIQTIYAYNQMSELTLKYYNKFDQKDKIHTDIQNKEKEKLNIFSDTYNVKEIEAIETEAGVSSALLSYAETHKPDLIVLGSKGVNNTSAFLYGSTTSYLMENLTNDLLIYVPEQ